MAWYSASVLLKGDHLSRPQVKPLWEEKLLLIQAASEEEARQEAVRIGKDLECEYDVADGKSGHPPGRLRWGFQTVERVICIESPDLLSGTEVFSRFLRDSEVRSLLTPFSDTERS